jgi:hypothetical protein
LSAEILQSKREWDDIFKVLKEKKILPINNTKSIKIGFSNEREILSQARKSLPLDLPYQK